MKTHQSALDIIGLATLAFALSTNATPRYVDLNCANPTPPYAEWTTAATNIQDAIDASTDGDLILVTNGIYPSGGRVMAGDLTNRVALNKALTVQSVNGPFSTIIQGAGATNGPAAVRCAWLTNGALLIGFTLQGGAVRASADNTLGSGGGVWCASSNAVVANCVIVSNTGYYYASGCHQGTLNNCLVTSNVLVNSSSGGAAYNNNLNNCTVISNTAYGVYTLGLGAPGRVTNCIVYYNSGGNYFNRTLAYCCTTPLAAGVGNLTNAPQLFVDGHLGSTSPCRGAGTNLATGTDLFGQPWQNPPSVGCAEWQPAPLAGSPSLLFTNDPVGFRVKVSSFAGQPPFTNYWLKDGVPLQDDGHFSSTQTTNLVATGVSFADAGAYQLVVTNAFGTTTSAVVRLVVHCVDAAGLNPVPPYSTWEMAATNIQDAIGAALAGEVVLVTNGVYASGGKSIDGVITNRVSVDKAMLVQSANGPSVTLIQGAVDPTSTNGPGAVRCAWLTTNAILSGFTLSGGATRGTTSSASSQIGGGVLGNSTSASVYNCVLATNYAAYSGGGAYSVFLNHCSVTANRTVGSEASGGGVAHGNLKNCFVSYNVSEQGNGGGTLACNATNCAFTQNRARLYGSAAYSGTLVNCTVSGNVAGGYSTQSGAVAYASLVDCIVYANGTVSPGSYTNYYSCTFSYCDTDPLASGTGNINTDPQLLADGIHIAATSPCRGVGTNLVIGTDIDGQPWANPPSMGCDEWQPTPLVSGQPQIQLGGIPLSATFGGLAVSGQAPFSYRWLKDGALLEDGAQFSATHSPNLVALNFGPADAGGYQLVASNSFGMATSVVVQVTVHAVDAAGASPLSPYASWATAATNIQDAVDAAAPGDYVVVTNGVYANGGRAMSGTLTNRVALTKPLTVVSVNGALATAIEGAWDPASVLGALAVRCAWLADGATLSGFTLRKGATQPFTGLVGSPLISGGGAWCVSTNGVVSNCILTNNVAGYGGGISYGRLNNSLVVGNRAASGGGAYYAALNNCTVLYNYTTTVFTYNGAGTYYGRTRNSIVRYNYNNYPSGTTEDNTEAGTPQYTYCCTSPLFSGAGNINADPQLLDPFHIAVNSPCYHAGSPLYSSGMDLDGEPWNNPPSMGYDEVVLVNLVGPLAITLQTWQTNLLVSRPGSFSARIAGRASAGQWSFGDGVVVTNTGTFAVHQWTNAGDYWVTFTAYNTDHPGGVSTNLLVHILPVLAPQLQSAGLVSNAFQFQFNAQSSATYSIQATTNLAPPAYWQTLQMIYNSPGGMYQISDFGAVSNGNRFYRVLAQ
jgi:hypothetical protein